MTQTAEAFKRIQACPTALIFDWSTSWRQAKHICTELVRALQLCSSVPEQQTETPTNAGNPDVAIKNSCCAAEDAHQVLPQRQPRCVQHIPLLACVRVTVTSYLAPKCLTGQSLRTFSGAAFQPTFFD